MVIGYDAKRAFNNSSGLGNYSRFIIESVQRLLPEHETLLFTPKINSRYATFTSGKNIVSPRGGYKLIPSLWRAKFCTTDIKKHQIDVFHGLSNELPYGIEKTNAKKVVTVHDLIFKRFPEFYKNPFDVKAYDKKFSHACNVADKIIAISQQTKNDIIHYYGIDEEKVVVIYQDCDSQFHQIVTDLEKQTVKLKYKLPNKFILSVGTIEKRKNQLSTIRALADLHDASINLVLIGKETEYQQEVINEAKRLHVEHRVQIINNADFIDFPAIYQQAFCKVYPSHFEGFGIPILEALNSNIPIITSTGSCFSEVGGDVALYADSTDYKAIATHLKALIEHPDKRKEIISKTQDQAMKFRAENTITSLSKVYNLRA